MTADIALIRIVLVAGVLAAGAAWSPPALAQSTTELATLMPRADALGASWTIFQQGPDDELKAFSPAPVAGVGTVYSNRPQVALVLLGQFADRATAMAAPGRSAPGGYWGQANTTFQPISGYGDDGSYRVRPLTYIRVRNHLHSRQHRRADS